MTSLKRLSQPRSLRLNILLVRIGIFIFVLPNTMLLLFCSLVVDIIVISCISEDGSSWDVVSEDDLWDEESMGQRDEDYVLVREEDIAEGIACFMATYLSSLKQTKVY